MTVVNPSQSVRFVRFDNVDNSGRALWCCVQDVVCDEGSVCTVTTQTACELDMCRLEYVGQCTGIYFNIYTSLFTK